MKIFLIVLFLISLLGAAACTKHSNKSAANIQSTYGKWTAISKACVPGSVLIISDGKMEYPSEGYAESFILVDANNLYPEAFADMPADSMRYIVKLLNSKNARPGMTPYVSLSVYHATGASAGSEAKYLVVMDKDFKDDGMYFQAKKAGKDIFGWSACVYEKPLPVEQR